MGWARGHRRRWLSGALGLMVVAMLCVGVGLATHPATLTADSAAAARAGSGSGSGSGPAPQGDSAAPPTVAAVPRPVVLITPDSGTALNPTDPIVVKVERGTAHSVVVTNSKTGTAVPGKLTKDGSSWTSSGTLAYGATYDVAVDSVATDGSADHQTGTVHTISPSAQAYPSFIPAPNQPSVGVGQPIVVRFDHPIHDRATAEKDLSVTASPPQPGGWYWLSNTEVHYRPQSYWRPGTTITVKANLFGVDLGSGVYGATDRTETVHVHDAWIAKADGKTDQMQIFDNGALVKTMPISLGSPGFPSHTGPHVITDKQPSVIMDSCTYGVCQGQPGYYREQVNLDERISNDGEFVHSAPWSVDQQGSDNVSHGCVNLSPDNAQWFFDHFNIGDVVEITNSGGPPLPIDDTYGDWELSWSQWQAGSALNS
ncbi:L,D-transpeptidase [Pseudonocardia acidicola]|uniref:L,D-transpeptidase n=1 Tax=Pseudonocardia acidicola TaxID=2724939 RepID=A0ABX1S384_9PSEU|nr:Ig-like domain-containing protein [Pseudonocardia acidicola]NMH96023.1 L,D-transpeptidase [Pseudonocardia acidicola]